jgi:hypothetical protein
MNELARFLDDPGLRFNRRHFFSRTSLGLGGAALASLLCEPGAPSAPGADTAPTRPKPIAGMIDPASGGILKAFHVAPKAKRIIYLFMSG